jgi:hypothetical protein
MPEEVKVDVVSSLSEHSNDVKEEKESQSPPQIEEDEQKPKGVMLD